ncbi:hypothetical protein LguiA_034121 [Lonicera macranthoides]
MVTQLNHEEMISPEFVAFFPFCILLISLLLRRPESRTKSRHDPTATASAPAATIPAPSRAKPPSKKRPKK